MRVLSFPLICVVGCFSSHTCVCVVLGAVPTLGDVQRSLITNKKAKKLLGSLHPSGPTLGLALPNSKSSADRH